MYSAAYIILFLFYAALALIYHYTAAKQYRAWIKVVAVAVFILFFGFRGFVGDDWLIYYPNFDGMYDDKFSNAFMSISASEFEPGFSLFQALCKFIYPDYHFFVFVCCVINCALLYRFFRKKIDNLPLCLMVFISMSGTGLQINLLRNSMALFMCLNALEYIVQRKPLQYFGICLLATTFHISSVVFFPLYFFLHKRVPRWAYILLFVFAAIFLLAQINFIGPILLHVASYMGELYVELVRNYTESEYATVQGVLSIGYLERLATGILIICYYDKLVRINKENTLFINAFLLYFLSFALFREFDIACRRIVLMFVYSYWILWCDLLKCFSVRGNKMIFAAFLLCYGVLKVHSMTNEPKSQYDNILFGAKSYEERYTIYMLNKED